VSARPADGGGVQRPGAPFIVAHRAGNDLARLRAAEQRGLDLVGADVRLFPRLEVRHLKTIRPSTSSGIAGSWPTRARLGSGWRSCWSRPALGRS
jgi:hypothetical protein